MGQPEYVRIFADGGTREIDGVARSLTERNGEQS